jgi:hypothetical protein
LYIGKKNLKFVEDHPINIHVLQWWPSWISDRHKKQKLGKGHSNDNSFTRIIQGTFLLSLIPIVPVVSEKKLEM